MKKKLVAGLLLAIAVTVTGCREKQIDIVTDIPTDISVIENDVSDIEETDISEEVVDDAVEEVDEEIIKVVNITDNFAISIEEGGENSHLSRYYQFYEDYVRQDVTLFEFGDTLEEVKITYCSFIFTGYEIRYTDRDVYLVAPMSEGDAEKFGFATREEIKPNLDRVVESMTEIEYTDIEGYTSYDVVTLSGDKYNYLLNSNGDVEIITEYQTNSTFIVTENLQGISYFPEEYSETTVDYILEFWNQALSY